MKLIIGLGNPGEKYKNMRHNVGFLVLEELKNKIHISNIKYQNDNLEFKDEKKFKSLVCIYSQLTTNNSQLILAKPQTFMNESGSAVSRIANFYKIKPDDIYVIHDDLDIALGEYKIQLGKGPKVHYGIQSIDKTLGTNNYWRVRVGVENRGMSKELRIKGEDYVLQRFEEDESGIINSTIEKVVEDLYNKVIY